MQGIAPPPGSRKRILAGTRKIGANLYAGSLLGEVCAERPSPDYLLLLDHYEDAVAQLHRMHRGLAGLCLFASHLCRVHVHFLVVWLSKKKISCPLCAMGRKQPPAAGIVARLVTGLATLATCLWHHKRPEKEYGAKIHCIQFDWDIFWVSRQLH